MVRVVCCMARGLCGHELVACHHLFYTLQNYRGGSVTAGIFKGLQAVLVFGAAHLVYCQDDKEEDEDNWWNVSNAAVCFSPRKAASLILVVTGVAVFAVVTPNPTTSTTTKADAPHSSTDIISDSSPTSLDSPTSILMPTTNACDDPEEASRLLVPLASSSSSASDTTSSEPGPSDYYWMVHYRQ